MGGLPDSVSGMQRTGFLRRSPVDESLSEAEQLLLRPRTLRWRLASGIWLIFLADTVVAVWESDHPPVVRAAGLLGLLAFGILYVVVVPLLMSSDVDDRQRMLFVAGVFLLTCAILPIAGQSGLNLYVFVAVVAIMLLETRPAVVVVASILLLAPLLELAVPSWPNSLNIDLGIATASAAVFGVASVIRRNRALAEAHEELKTMAVEQERARFARDLHDLLGHSLTVITVKSELAGRLLDRDPQRAAAEVADIERLAREALADVRSTVAGYRGVTLAAEISSARAALDAAGMAAELPGAVDDVPGDRRELFGWVLREGVTNVLRHSDAHRVRVSLSARTVEIVDDGSMAASGVEGNGLSGLRERLSQVGGRLDAGPAEGGGFRLYAELPA
jgi:two-component system, NarL family, sensor histidine kinase DesK